MTVGGMGFIPERLLMMMMMMMNTCPREAPRLGYVRIRYFNWVGITGHPVCIRRTFNCHLGGSIASTTVTNLSRFRVGAWQLKVNDHNSQV